MWWHYILTWFAASLVLGPLVGGILRWCERRGRAPEREETETEWRRAA